MATVLIVDDRDTNRQLLRTLLSYRGHEILEARDGEEALAITGIQHPDLVVTDILMPHMDGYEFIKRLRSSGEHARLPVIVCSATYEEQEARALASQCGVAHVFVHPIDPKAFLDAVEEALTSEAQPAPEISDAPFASEHRRLLTDKLAQKVAELESEIVRRQETEERLAIALASSGQGIVDWDLKSDQQTVTAFDAKSAVATHRAEKHNHFLQNVHPSDVAGLDAAIAKAKDERGDLRAQFRMAQEGGDRMMEMRGRFRYDENGTPTRLLGTVLDITDRVAEESDRRRLAALVHHSPYLVASATAEGQVTFVNLAGRVLVGLDELQEVAGDDMFQYISPEDATLVRDTVIPSMLAEGEWRGEIRFTHQQTGEPIVCECGSFALFDSRGNITDMAVIARDIRERKANARQSSARLARITALQRIDLAISSAVDLRLTLQIVVSEVTALENVTAAGIYTYDNFLRRLDFACGSDFGDVQNLEALLKQAVADRKVVSERSGPDFEGGLVIDAYPLVAKGFVKGVLTVAYRTVTGETQELSSFLEAIVAQAAIAIDNAILFEDLQRSRNDLVIAYDETLEGWSRALDLRDKETEGHSRRVTELTLKVARAMGIAPEELQHIRRGALLHDIGKVGVPDGILLKPGPLTADELTTMRKHTDYAWDLLAPIAFLRSALDIPYCHHEKWDGTGYPRGLKGPQIPLPARIFAVADVWDALSSDRPYRSAWTRERVLEHIAQSSGTHFDPAVVEVFLRLMAEESDASSERVTVSRL